MTGEFGNALAKGDFSLSPLIEIEREEATGGRRDTQGYAKAGRPNHMPKTKIAAPSDMISSQPWCRERACAVRGAINTVTAPAVSAHPKAPAAVFEMPALIEIKWARPL
jgi:hypothetical protein